MTRQLQSCLHELAVANRIFANEGIIDAFGHVSARHPFHSNRYFLSCARPPELIEVSDLIEFTLDGEACTLYSGRDVFRTRDSR